MMVILTMKTTGKCGGKSATTQIRHNSEKRVLCFFLPCDWPSIHLVVLGIRWQSEACKSRSRRNAEGTLETKPQGIAFIIGELRHAILRFIVR